MGNLRRPPPELARHREIAISRQHLRPAAKHWQVQVKIPIFVGDPGDAGIDLPAGEDFGLYFSVIVAETDMLGRHLARREFSWPLGADVGTFIEATPATGAWGNGIFGSTQNGVSISSGESPPTRPRPTHIDSTCEHLPGRP